MSEEGNAVVDTVSIVVFPQHPTLALGSVESLWRTLFSADPEKVESFPARGSSTALGMLDSYGFAIIQSAVSAQFVVGAPGMTPPPPSIGGGQRYRFDELIEVLKPVVAKFISAATSVARIGVHARRVELFSDRDEANRRAFELAGVQGDASNLTDIALQLNRPTSAQIEGVDLTLNLLRQVGVKNIVTANVLLPGAFQQSAQGTASEWEVLLGLDCNVAPSPYVYTEDTPMAIISALIDHMRSEVL